MMRIHCFARIEGHLNAPIQVSFLQNRIGKVLVQDQCAFTVRLPPIYQLSVPEWGTRSVRAWLCKGATYSIID
mgnify:CR=1 FL=1